MMDAEKRELEREVSINLRLEILQHSGKWTGFVLRQLEVNSTLPFQVIIYVYQALFTCLCLQNLNNMQMNLFKRKKEKEPMLI